MTTSDGSMWLGIDGGGTSCRARLVDRNGAVLGEGAAGAANLTLGVEIAVAAIRAAARLAFDQAGLSHSDLMPQARAGLGLAGANLPSLVEAIRKIPLGFASVVVASDALVACLGAHGGRDGAILILGTGSHGLAIVNGRATTVGGWGFALSDDASGATLGRSAVRSAIAAWDGLGPRSALTERIMDGFGHDPAAAAIWAATAEPRDYGAFAPLVFELGATGDEIAAAILRDAAARVDAMLGRLAALGAARIALMGGLARPYEPWLESESRRLLVEPAGDAMDGAILMARRDGIPKVTETI
jgi:glucosamine kinase